MVLIELGNAGPEPVALAEAKTWCRIERDDEDVLIAALIGAARETVERETGLALRRRDLRIAIGDLPPDGRVALPRRPVATVLGLTAYGADGLPRAFAAANAVLERFGAGETVRLTEIVLAAANGLEIDVTAGFAPADVPEALKLAIKRMVAVSYETRAALAPEMQPALIPPAARAAIAAFREVRL
ncbi:hypothetical protein GCM10011390_10650 [Aureimonas endophytica]|uniref:PhiE125 gp8 family phage protein n=1 Tax=Aureimonas endophytica TaxID=2027858 RepID=A0A917E1U3_9HYPH|nr:head-tail connector protein [Aureimonas endophytica]GGD93787.1 hypothetical protein GCM10011390_10650 [Aureimonas endophytica]